MRTLSEKETTEDEIIKEEMQEYYYKRKDVKRFIKDLKFIMPSTFHYTIEELAGDKLI